MRFLRNVNDIESTVQNYLLNDSGSSEGNFMQVRVLLPAPEIVDNIDDIYIVPFLCGF